MRIQRLFGVMHSVASLSKDPRTKVGALIVDRNGAIRSSGFNGFPRGVDDDPERYNNRDIKLKLVAHAEANAIANAAGVGTPLIGCTLLVNKFPCHECAKLIINAGINEVYAPAPEGSWIDSNNLARLMFNEAGVTVIYTNLMT